MLERIEKTIDQLSPAESRVARWVLEYPRRAADATLAEVASECGTSQPTVIRFCRHVGLAGFRELALRLTEDLSRPGRFVHRDVNEDDRPADVATKIIDSAVRTLLEQRQWLQSTDIQQAASLLANARQIVFAGVGGSGHVSTDACHKFFRLGIPCSALTDVPSIRQSASIAGAGDVFVITSNSGRWSAMEDAAVSVRRLGGAVIAITDPETGLGKAASLAIPCSYREDTGVYTPMNSRLAQLAVLDVLQVATALVLGRPAADKLAKTKQALTSNLST
ncbi:MAG: SIS domain-containing protein [Pseudomonadota bacterium]